MGKDTNTEKPAENTNDRPNENTEKKDETTKTFSSCPDCVDVNGVSTGLNPADRTQLCTTCKGSGKV